MNFRRTLKILVRHWRGWFLAAFVAIVVRCLYTGASMGDWMELASAALFVLGFCLNLLVILVNDGYMPARIQEAELSESFKDTHKPMDGRTRASFLGDWIPLGRSLWSPGDVCMTLGLALSVVA